MFTGIINILYRCVCLEMKSMFGLTSLALLQVLEICTVMQSVKFRESYRHDLRRRERPVQETQLVIYSVIHKFITHITNILSKIYLHCVSKVDTQLMPNRR